ncbi:MAG: KH domain-containing protein [Nitrososphaerota archaeon]|nr:KH domain-containing protein [Candidatus Bathyarchaeota archaeon]MDW8048132.1 KH domain-containing protein [Nitrososphaerota archaeon]
MAQLFVKIPHERIGVLIGRGGEVKEKIEENLGVRLEIDGKSGDVTISLKDSVTDPSNLFRAKDVVLAIGRGFSPERAYRLIEDEETVLTVIDLREFFGKSDSDIRRIKGRIIGKDGKTRKILEEMTETMISVYGHTVSIIGGVEQTETARRAIDLLIKGSQHSTVYKFLQKERHELKKRRLQLWQDSEEKDLIC